METYVDDPVTGATTEVELLVDLPIDRVWALVTAVERIGEWSPECAFAAWRPDQGQVPHPGARFDARNEYADGFVAAVECVVTEVVPPHVFEWVVLDDDQDLARPGSIWRYELEPAGPRGTRVRQRFTHGPGLTGLREGSQQRPERAAASVAGRLEQLRGNMRTTLTAMLNSNVGEAER